MRHLTALFSVLLFTAGARGFTGEAAEVRLNGHTFTLPEGFEIELVAGPPLVDRPISADFDEKGRLYVTDSSGSNEPVKVQLEKRPHRVMRLVDTDGDGRFDRSTVFADRMMFPEGTMWYDGSLYVAAPPQIWKLTDTDDDGVADHREVWFDGKTLTGCANDLHGPYLGPDGWIYWCKGAFAEQTYERPGKPPLVTRASHIFRRRPEGGPIEPVMTGGMDNPVDVVFTPGGERIFTTTFFQHPGGGLRDGLIHAVYGGVYGKVHGVLDGHPRTGPIMPVLTHLGPVAPCGLTRLHSGRLGEAYQNNLLACLFSLKKVTRHVLTPVGATFKTTDSDFLASGNVDFHPTDVIEDADGSVLVIDTGGWYHLCCPTSQMAKPDVLGAIYRVRRNGAHQLVDARGIQIDWNAATADQLCDLLGDARVAVRNRARQRLGELGQHAVPALRQVFALGEPEQRLGAVWALTRIDTSAARAAVREALADKSQTVRQAALHSISVRNDRDAQDAMLAALSSASPHNRRAAAEGLARIGTADAVPELLAAAAGPADRVLEHSLIYALLEIADPAQTRVALAHANTGVRRAALIALDQMAGGDLRIDDVRGLLDAKQPRLRETAWWIADHHPEWAPGLAGYFQAAVKNGVADADEAALLVTRLARFSGDAAVQQVIADGLRDDVVEPATRIALLNAMAASRLDAVPGAWSEALLHALQSADPRLLDPAVAAVKALAGEKPDGRLTHRLDQIARDRRLRPGLRLRALAATPPAARSLNDPLVHFLCERLAADQPVALRALAVDVLLSTPLDAEQLLAVAHATAATGPMELRRLMELFAKETDQRVGLQLVESLKACPAASVLATDELSEQLSGFGQEVLRTARPLLARIEEENRAKTQKLEAVLALVDNGDVRDGHQLFRSNKAACTSCHAMGYLGGTIGPDLSRIGRVRSERDLLESILFPSVSFVRSYEPVTILTAQGQVYNGVIRDENVQEVTLQLDAEKHVRIPVADIEQRSPATRSIMPEGLDQQLTAQELADLVLFLKASQ